MAAWWRARIGPGGEVGGRQLDVAQAHIRQLEQQPSNPPHRRPLLAVGLLLAQHAETSAWAPPADQPMSPHRHSPPSLEQRLLAESHRGAGVDGSADPVHLGERDSSGHIVGYIDADALACER